jgi:hypothetical protein
VEKLAMLVDGQQLWGEPDRLTLGVEKLAMLVDGQQLWGEPGRPALGVCG